MALSTHPFDGIRSSAEPFNNLAFVSLQMYPCVRILAVSRPVKHVSHVDVPTKLKALLFRKLSNGYGLNLNSKPRNKVDFDFVAAN